MAMASSEVDMAVSASPVLDPRNGENGKSRGLLLEKKIEYLESLTGAGKVNRRSRRWLNDRLLMELVPRLNAEEIRGLFSPPPWGEDVQASTFCTEVGLWDQCRNLDVDKEANIICALESSCTKKKACADADKVAALNAWHRIDDRTREALRRSFLTELIENYENSIRAFLVDDQDRDELALSAQDPFHRLLLHGVCEFYNLVSVTVAQSHERGSLKITKIKKKQTTALELPKITLCQFLKMSKEGIW